MHSVPPMISPRTENQGVDALSRVHSGVEPGRGFPRSSCSNCCLSCSQVFWSSFLIHSSPSSKQSLLSQGTAANPALGLGNFHFWFPTLCTGLAHLPSRSTCGLKQHHKVIFCLKPQRWRFTCFSGTSLFLPLALELPPLSHHKFPCSWRPLWL